MPARKDGVPLLMLAVRQPGMHTMELRRTVVPKTRLTPTIAISDATKNGRQGIDLGVRQAVRAMTALAHSFRTGTGRYDPFGKPSAMAAILRAADGRSRRKPAVRLGRSRSVAATLIVRLSPSPLRPRFQPFDHSRNRRLFASRDRDLLADGGQLAVAQRVLAKPLVPVDDRRQFPARPLKDIDDALGLVEVVMKVFQRRFAHRPTPHPRGLLRGVANALLDEDPLDDVNADLAPSSE
jgi:hypothetical protein